MTGAQLGALDMLINALARHPAPRDVDLATCLRMVLDGYRANAHMQGAIDRLAAWQRAEAHQRAEAAG